MNRGDKIDVKKAKVYVICICVCYFFLTWNLQEAIPQNKCKGDKVMKLDSPKTSLLIIDIQNDYFPGGKFELTGSAEAGVQAKKVLDAFRAKSLPVVHIQHESKNDSPDFFAPNSDGQKIHKNIAPLPGEQVYTKHTVSSFEKTPLLEYLKKEKIRRLIIVGMQTNVCVLGTAKDGVKNGFEIIVLSDATAARNLATYNETLPQLEAEGTKRMTVEEFFKAISED